MKVNWKSIVLASCSGLALAASAMAQPANNACASASVSPIPAAGGTVTGTTVGATNDGAGCGSSTPGFDVYHSFSPAANGPWKLSLCSSSVTWDSVLSIHTGCPASAANLVAGSCADDNCGTLSELPSIALVASTPYVVRVSTYSPTLGNPSPYTLVVTNLGVPGACCATTGSCSFSAGGPSGCISGETFQAGGTCSPTNTCPQPPANDNCADAGLSPIPGAGGNVLGTTVAASPEAAFNDPACGSTNGKDVWHAWTPDDAGPWKLQTCGTVPTWDSVVSVHQGCPIDNTNNNLVACNDDFCAPLSSIESVTLAAATPYVVRVSTYSDFYAPGPYTLKVINLNSPGNCCLGGVCTLTTSGTAGCDPSATFTAGGVCEPNPCPQPPANDACETATVVSTLPFNSGTIPIGLATADIDVLCNAGSAAATNNGVWFTYTPAANCIASINHSSIDGVNAVFTGVCGGLAEQACSDPATLSYSMLGGTQYYILVGYWYDTQLATTATTVVTIDCIAPPPAPANDDCATAAVIGALPYSSGAIVVGGAASDLDVACNSGVATAANNGIWFTYTPAVNCFATLTQGGSSDGVTAVFASNDCNNLGTEVSCSDPTVTNYLLTGGQTYMILVGAYAAAALGPAATFSLDMDCVPPPPAPSNDECAAALVIAAVPYDSGPISVGGAGPDANVVCNTGGATQVNAGVWFTYSPSSDCTIALGETGSLDAIHAVYTGGCGALSEVQCSVNDLGNAFPGVGGTVYHILVGVQGTATPAPAATLTLTLDCVNAPANDLCAGAIALSIGATETVPVPAVATPDIDSTCNAGSNTETRFGVWYTYTTGADVGTLQLTDNSSNDVVFQVFTGGCDGLTPLVCTDAEAPASLALPTPNTTYHILMGLWGSTATPGAAYSITATSFTAVTGACCTGSSCSVGVVASACAGPTDTWLGANTTCIPQPPNYEVPNASVPDGDGGTATIGVLERTLTVSGATGPITSVTVTIDYSHTWAGDNQIYLIAPDSTSAALIVRPGTTAASCDVYGFAGGTGSLNDFNGIYLISDAGASTWAAAVTAGPSPLASGTYQASSCENAPVSLNATFAASNPNGIWTLRIQDHGGGDLGTLRAWGLNINNAPDVGPCPTTTNDNCCRGTTCNAVASGACTGTVAGSTSQVVASCGTGNAFASCCYADFNHDGTQSIDDLFLYFNAYFTGSPMADFGGDGTSQPTIDDLFLYINAYFGTCS